MTFEPACVFNPMSKTLPDVLPLRPSPTMRVDFSSMASTGRKFRRATTVLIHAWAASTYADQARTHCTISRGLFRLGSVWLGIA
jgi:hypothetical protein